MKLDLDAFKQLMQTLADGWNAYDPKKSVECFTSAALAPFYLQNKYLTKVVILCHNCYQE